MGTKFVDSVFLVTEECCNCGMVFAMTQDFQSRRLKDHKDFYCPAGHSQHYIGQSEEQKLRKKLDDTISKLQAERGRALVLESQKNAVTRAHNRMRDRVKNGVCPCCNRTFQNLLQHMRTEHPGFGSHQTLKALRDTFGLSQSAVADEIGNGVNQGHISAFERDRPVTSEVREAIESWINSNGGS